MQARNPVPILFLSYASPVLAQTVVPPNQQATLSAHNAERQSLGIPPLQWSSDLQSLAQDWVNMVAQRDPFPPFPPDHRPNRNNILSTLPGYIGENIYVSDFPSSKDGPSGVRTFIGEKVWYNYNLDTGYSCSFPQAQGAARLSRVIVAATTHKWCGGPRTGRLWGSEFGRWKFLSCLQLLARRQFPRHQALLDSMFPG
jgi:Cysteine-rich secretory protein family